MGYQEVDEHGERSHYSAGDQPHHQQNRDQEQRADDEHRDVGLGEGREPIEVHRLAGLDPALVAFVLLVEELRGTGTALQDCR